jgi:thioredoxin reductase (NADPH)
MLLSQPHTEQVTLLTMGESMNTTVDERERMQAAGIRVIEEPVVKVLMDGERIEAVTVSSGALHRFHLLYSALGTTAQSGLAHQLGAARDANSCIEVGQHQETSVPGVYAAGDVVEGVDQIAVAMGHAAIAACAIHNRLRSES